jgi:hypothetical protein
MAPPAESREPFEKLQLNIAYQPEDQVLNVGTALYQDACNDIHGQPHLRAEDQLAPPAGADRVLRKIVRLKRRLELPTVVDYGPQRFTTKKPPTELT